MALTHQQELFAQSVASGKTQSEAYRIAYPKSLKWKPESVWNKAYALSTHVEVKARIAEIRGAVVDSIQMTLTQHLDRLAELSERASNLEQMSAAIAAEVARGKASGVSKEQMNIAAVVDHSVKIVFGDQE